MRNVPSLPPTAPDDAPSGLAALDALERCGERIEMPCPTGKLVWHHWGEGPPLVLLHGSHGWWAHWARNIPWLSRHRSVWVPDLPGMGQSSPPEGSDHAAVFAPLAENLRALVPGPVDLVGFSYGAVIATHLSAHRPEQVRTLVIVNPGGLGTPLGHFELKSMKGLSPHERRAAGRSNLLSLMLRDPASLDEIAMEIQSRGARQNRVHPTPLVMPDHIVNVLARVRAPVHAIWGELDAAHPDPALQKSALQTVRPDVGFSVIGDAGHWCMYERPEVFEAILEPLLAPLDDSAER